MARPVFRWDSIDVCDWTIFLTLRAEKVSPHAYSDLARSWALAFQMAAFIPASVPGTSC